MNNKEYQALVRRTAEAVGLERDALNQLSRTNTEAWE
jgi:hypothetical protein